MSKPVIRPLIICGPSGVGKGTLINKLLEEFPKKFGFSVSHTTRKPRQGEIDGVHYHFTNVESMKKEIDNHQFLEHAWVHGNLYGTSVQAVKNVQEKGLCCVIDIDVQGATQVKKNHPKLNTFAIFIKAPSVEELKKRLIGRQSETDESLQLRLKNAIKEMQFGDENLGTIFDAMLVNDKLDVAYKELKQIIQKNLNIDLGVQ